MREGSELTIDDRAAMGCGKGQGQLRGRGGIEGLGMVCAWLSFSTSCLAFHCLAAEMRRTRSIYLL